MAFFSKALLILPTICILGKATNSNNVLLSTYGKISSLHSCHTATFINLELNAEIPLTVLIILFSQYVCNFPESEILLLDQWQLMVPLPPLHSSCTKIDFLLELSDFQMVSGSR